MSGELTLFQPNCSTLVVVGFGLHVGKHLIPRRNGVPTRECYRTEERSAVGRLVRATNGRRRDLPKSRASRLEVCGLFRGWRSIQNSVSVGEATKLVDHYEVLLRVLEEVRELIFQRW